MADEFIIKKGLKVGPLLYPNTDGIDGQVITTDGSGNLTFEDATAVGGTEERFQVNYLSSGDINNITNETSGVSTTVTGAAAGTVEVTFTGHTFPPSSIIVYGYSQTTDEYIIVTVIDATWTDRKIDGGGAAAFGSFAGKTMTLTLNRTNTGSSAGGGQPTHSWVMFWFGT